VLSYQFLPKQLRILLFAPTPFAFEIRPLANLFAKKSGTFLTIPVFLISFCSSDFIRGGG